MKKFVFASMTLIYGAALNLSAAEVTYDVVKAMEETGNAKIIITFKDKTNRSKLKRKSSLKEVNRQLKANFKAASREVLDVLETKGKMGAGQVTGQYWAANAVSATVDKKMLSRLSGRDDIAQITLDRVIMFEEPPQVESTVKDGQDWTYGLKKLGVPEVRQSYNLTGDGITVAVLDTGIDAEHPDLAGKVVAWKDWAGDSEEPKDAHGHGTHCAGTIAGGATSGRAIGVAPDAKLVIGRIFGDNGSATLSGILGAMNWVTDPDGDAETNDAPQLVSNSWGGKQGSMESEKSMWNLVKTWRSLNIVPVFAAGNSGPWPKTVGTPGGYPHSYAVGATNGSDKAAYFSSRGPIKWEDVTYTKPDISAPGVGVLSAKPGGGYQKMSGTSMACPHVAGLVALMLQANPSLSVKQVEELLNSSAVDLGKDGLDNTYGHGRADIKTTIDTIKGAKDGQEDKFNSLFTE
ncbi:MAG: S8 family serine peptidase [bacterium]|nr:S8 family serine peptidase [bacterium]